MMTSWHGILIMRALIGLSLSGVAAVGMTYLSEEIHPSFVAFSMGLYISGNSIGGMSGRLLSGVFTDFFNWRIALAVIGCFALASALMFWKILPESRHFRPTSLRPKTLFINFRLHWRDQGLPRLFLTGFLLMGSFVTLFNYIGYRLMLSPWHLSQALVGLLSVAYLTGTWSSPKAGAMTARFGRGPVMLVSTAVMLFGLLMTLFSSLWLIFAGMLLFSAGFFAAHSVASSWIGPRARRAGAGRAQPLGGLGYSPVRAAAEVARALFKARFGRGPDVGRRRLGKHVLIGQQRGAVAAGVARALFGAAATGHVVQRVPQHAWAEVAKVAARIEQVRVPGFVDRFAGTHAALQAHGEVQKAAVFGQHALRVRGAPAGVL